ncbi:MAG: hypothetical protein ACK5UT_25680, partial [Acidobacteriota bacterium]
MIREDDSLVAGFAGHSYGWYPSTGVCRWSLAQLAGRDGEDRLDAFRIANGDLHVCFLAEPSIRVDGIAFDEDAFDGIERGLPHFSENPMQPLDYGAIEVAPERVTMIP